MKINPDFGVSKNMTTHSGHYEISSVIWNEISQGYLKLLTKALSVGEDLNADKSVLLDITNALTLSVSMAKEMSLGAGSIVRSSCKRIGTHQFRETIFLLREGRQVTWKSESDKNKNISREQFDAMITLSGFETIYDSEKLRS